MTPTVCVPQQFWFRWKLRLSLWRQRPWYTLRLRM